MYATRKNYTSFGTSGNLYYNQLNQKNNKINNFFSSNNNLYNLNKNSYYSPNKINKNYSYNLQNNYNFSPIRPYSSYKNLNFSNKNYNSENNNNIPDRSTSKDYKMRSMSSFFENYSKKVQAIKNIINIKRIDYKNENNDFFIKNFKNKNILEVEDKSDLTFLNTENDLNYQKIKRILYSKNIFGDSNCNKNLLNRQKKNLLQSSSTPIKIIHKKNISVNDFDNSIEKCLNEQLNYNIENNNNSYLKKSIFSYKNININKKEITLNNNNFSNGINDLIRKKKNFFVYMYAEADYKGVSWCSDCIFSESFIKNGKEFVLENKLPKKIYWVNIPISKYKRYSYKYNNILKLKYVPTIIYFEKGIEVRRIVQQETFSQERINSFILSAYNSFN